MTHWGEITKLRFAVCRPCLGLDADGTLFPTVYTVGYSPGAATAAEDRRLPRLKTIVGAVTAVAAAENSPCREAWDMRPKTQRQPRQGRQRHHGACATCINNPPQPPARRRQMSSISCSDNARSKRANSSISPVYA